MFWQLRNKGTEIVCTPDGKGTEMLWKFYFKPRRGFIYLALFVSALPLLILFGLIGYICICRDYLKPDNSPRYSIRKPIGVIPTVVECINLF